MKLFLLLYLAFVIVAVYSGCCMTVLLIKSKASTDARTHILTYVYACVDVVSEIFDQVECKRTAGWMSRCINAHYYGEHK